MRKRLWFAATILSALALLGTAAGAANSGADLTTLDPEGIVASVMSNLPTTAATQASEHATQANENDETETENDDDNPQISASTEASPSGTTSTKPGWGCGDKNHEHSGPPGNPDADPPPGCDKAGSGGQSGEHGNSSGDHGQSADHRVTPGVNNPGKGKGK